MARYQETSNAQYVRDTETGAFIPKDGTYLSFAFQSWVALGNRPDPVPEPSRDETVSRNLATQASLLRNASDVIAPLQDASDMGIATDDERQSLSVWKVYRVMVNRVDTTSAEPAWPPLPRSSLEA